MTRVRYDDGASDDLLAAVAWYQEQQPGLGAVFFDAVRATESAIVSHPSSHAQVDDIDGNAIRRAFVDGFPYGILFFVHADVAWIVAVAHARRRPGYWKSHTR